MIEAAGLGTTGDLYSEKLNITYLAPENRELSRTLALLNIDTTNLAQADRSVLRALVRANTLPIRVPSQTLFDGQRLPTLLAGSSESTYCGAGAVVPAVAVELHGFFTPVARFVSAGGGGDVQIGDISVCNSLMHATRGVLLPCCTPVPTVVRRLPGAFSAGDGVLVAGADQISFTNELLDLAAQTQPEALLLPTNRAFSRFNLAAALPGLPRDVALRRIAEFHAGGYVVRRFGELRARYLSAAGARAAACGDARATLIDFSDAPAALSRLTSFSSANLGVRDAPGRQLSGGGCDLARAARRCAAAASARGSPPPPLMPERAPHASPPPSRAEFCRIWPPSCPPRTFKRRPSPPSCSSSARRR